MYTFNDAFKALNALEEDVFDVSAEDSEKLKQFLDGAEDIDYEIIVDPEAENEEELQDSYEGDVILKCCICQQDLFKNPEEVIINDELGIANDAEECPYCHSMEGFKVIGQVAPFEAKEESEEKIEDETTDSDIEVKIDDEEIEMNNEESEEKNFDLDEALGLKEKDSVRDDIDADSDDKKEKDKINFRKAKDDADADRDYKLKKKGLKESRKLNETGEWEDDEEGTAWKEHLVELVKKYTLGIKDFEFDEEDVKGFDKYQGPYIDTESGGTIWSDPERDDSFIFEYGNGVYRISSREDAEDFMNATLKPLKDLRYESLKSLKESDKPAAVSVEDAQEWVDYDMKKYGKISDKTNELVKKAGFQIIKDDHGDYEVAAGQFEACKEDIKEDFEKVDIETDKEKMSMTAEENGKITVTTEPKEEMIAPLDAEVEDKFEIEDETSIEDENPTEDEASIDIDVDEFDETTFDELGEKYLKRVYENVKSFRTTQGTVKGNTIKLEGIITFKSGKAGKTSFIFESKIATKNNKVIFEGLNTNFAKGKKAFTLKGKVQDKKLISESLTYNYIGKDAATNTSKRLYGRVKI